MRMEVRPGGRARRHREDADHVDHAPEDGHGAEAEGVAHDQKEGLQKKYGLS